MSIQSKPIVKVIADSTDIHDNRIITFQLTYWRAIHAEVMTHREFSRNAGSSRARPSLPIIQQVFDNPWGPSHWGTNKKGMQNGEEGDTEYIEACKNAWRESARDAASHAKKLYQLGLHKHIVNRVLEPFTSIDVVVTSTSFDNFYGLRIHDDAAHEIRELASAMYLHQRASRPRLLRENEWHLPYVSDEERETLSTEVARKVSAARCARASYKLFDGTDPSISDDLDLYERLAGAEPVHASPLEHQATPLLGRKEYEHLTGNFNNWIQSRKLHPNEYISHFKLT
mgnify:CR=1 FL=1